MFIKIIKWQKEIGPNIQHPTEMYEASNYEIRDDGQLLRLDMVLTNGSCVTRELPRIELLKGPPQSKECEKECEFDGVASISVYVTNNIGKTVQTYNL